MTKQNENGNKVVNDDHEVIVEVIGGAKLSGLENGDISNTESYKKIIEKHLRGG